MRAERVNVRVEASGGRMRRLTSSSNSAGSPGSAATRRRNTKPNIVDFGGLRPPGFFRNIVVSPAVSHEAAWTSGSPLVQAYRDKDYDRLQALAPTVDLYAPLRGSRTIADVAAADGNLHVLEILDNSGFNFNKKNSVHYVPLHYAVEAKQLKAMRKLVTLGADANIPLPSGESLAHRACGMQDTSVLLCLLNQLGAEFDATDRQGNTPLHRACLEDSADHVRALLEFARASRSWEEFEEFVNVKGYEGKTALHIGVINQNREIAGLLLNNGAFVDVAADSKKTVIDQVLGLGSVVMMSDLAHFFTQEMIKSDVESFAELFQEQQFLQYLNFLDAVDNEYQTCSIDYETLTDEEERNLLSKLEKDDRIDLIEFKEVVLKLLQTEVIHVLQDPAYHDVLLKTCANIVRYVLFREDCVMLERIMRCGIVWWEVRTEVENHIDELYSHSPNRGVNGILTHLMKNFVVDSHLDREAFVKFYNMKCSNFKMAPQRSAELSAQSDYMRHPMDTLVMWSVFSGRYRLTEILLRQEKFDVVPLALYCAAVLRAFATIEEMSVDHDEMENLATKFEMFAAQIVENVHQLDTSYNKQVSVGYLLEKLPSYGDVSCIQLAARNSSAKFLQTTPGQEALNKRWFGCLLHLHPYVRELIIWLGVIPGNMLVPLALILLQRRRQSAEVRKDSMLSQRGGAQPESCSFLLPPAKDEKSSREASPELLGRTKSCDAKKSRLEAPAAVELSAENCQQDDAQAAKDPDGLGSNLFGLDSCLVLTSMMYNFYKIPAVRFRYHAMSHIILLLLLSYIILLDLEYTISAAEVAAYLIIFGFLMEEIAEFAQYLVKQGGSGTFFDSKWNIIDFLALVSATIGFFLRMLRCRHPMSNNEQKLNMDFNDDVWYAARLFLGMSCMLYWVRLLYISTVLEILGPKLKMIAKMITKDMMPFLFILFIFILGFGVLMHGLLFPNGHKAWNVKSMSTKEVLVAMFRICFYSMVGEYSLDLMDGQETCGQIYTNQLNNTDSCPHQYGRFLVPNVVMPLYVITTEILLLNLIIALFSKTIEEIDSRSKALWQFERHELIEEFEMRSSLPPPFNVVDMLRRLVKRLLHKSFKLFKEPFNKQLVLQYLLYQAFALRNNRWKLMEASSPRHDETDELLWRVRKIVRQELAARQEAPAPGRRRRSGANEEAVSLAKGSLLEAPPPPASTSVFATLMEEELEDFDQI